MKPGEEIIQQGIADLIDGKETISALLVSIGAPRLRRAGMEIPRNTIPSPERRLYLTLASDNSDSAHSRYNAWIRKLVSYERALRCGS